MARVLTAIIFLPILMGALWLGPPILFVGLTGVALLLGLREFHHLCGVNGRERWSGWGAVTILGGLFFWGRLDWVAGVIAACVVVEFLLTLWRHRDQEELGGALPGVGLRLLGILYLGLLGGYLVALRVIESEVPSLAAKLLTFFFLVVFAGDTGAYYTGRAIGRRKLAPRISPGKTWEGVAGGLLGNVIAVLLARATFFPELLVGEVIPLALLMGGLGVTGDLGESMIKRGAKAKDAGGLLPGHGGLLDRFDSMLFNAPVLYYYALYRWL
jgi:phosphatidate cytidylyltransferase